MEAHFFKLSLRKLGIIYWLEAEPAERRPGTDEEEWHIRPVRFRTERDVLRVLDAAHVGHWSSFPPEGVHATLSRTQLRTLGFRDGL